MFELLAAPHTPFDPSGELRLDAVASQAAHLRATGVDGVFVAGSTGEGHSLTTDERRRLAERWVAEAGGLRVVVHVGHASLREARELARHAAACGADALGAAPPSWFPIGTPEQLVAACAEIAAGAPELPLLYYHIPALSGVHVAMAPFLALARERVPSLAGVKYTHLDALDFQACVRDHGDALRLLWGHDELLVAGLDLGAHGAVGSTYNFAAPIARRLVAAHGAGNVAEARRLQARVALLVETLARRGYMASAKALMAWLGVDCGDVRPPLQGLDGPARDALRADLERIGFFGWLGEPAAP